LSRFDVFDVYINILHPGCVLKTADLTTIHSHCMRSVAGVKEALGFSPDIAGTGIQMGCFAVGENKGEMCGGEEIRGQ